MKTEVAKKIVRGIKDKIQCNTVDIDDWAEFWGFTREEYEEFLDMAIKASEQQPKRGKWIKANGEENLAIWTCDQCGCKIYSETECDRKKFHAWCGKCGCRMDADMRGDESK